MRKTIVLATTACMCFTYAFGQRLTGDKAASLKQHVYALRTCDQTPISNKRPSIHLLNHFRTLVINNYSGIELFSLAYGEGTVIPNRYISMVSAYPTKLFSRYCYQISIESRDAGELYKIMVATLHREFPDHEVVLKYQGSNRLLTFKDKKTL